MAPEITMTTHYKPHYVAIISLLLIACNNTSNTAIGVTEIFPLSLLRVVADGKYGYRDTNGKIVIAPCFTEKTGVYSEGLAAVPKECNTSSQWGYIDASAKFVIEAKFDTAADFSEGLAGVQIGENWGFIDKLGKLVVEPKYLSVCPYSEGLACVRLCAKYNSQFTCKYGYINKQGTMVIKPFTSHASDFSDGLAVTKIGDGFGYIDTQGRTVIEPRFDFSAQNFSEGLARIRFKGKFGYINRSGDMVIDTKYDAAGDFSEGMAYASVDGKYGFIDTNGQFVIEPSFDLILVDTKFKQSLACIGVGKQDQEMFHYIDKTGKTITSTPYHWCSNFQNGIASVDIKGNTFYINKHGEPIW